MENVTKNEYEEALRKVQKYYRQITGKKESVNFYIFYIQPIRKCIELCEGEKQTDTDSNCNLAGVSHCACSVEETTGWTMVKCCNICGKPLKCQNWHCG